MDNNKDRRRTSKLIPTEKLLSFKVVHMLPGGGDSYAVSENDHTDHISRCPGAHVPIAFLNNRSLNRMKGPSGDHLSMELLKIRDKYFGKWEKITY